MALALAACRPQVSATRSEPPWRAVAHAHNDYEHPRPLWDALEQGFESVEVDVWLAEGDIRVAHERGPFKGTLRGLYLEPLAARVRAKGGSVHGDGRPFYLWIDLKEGSAELTEALAAQLSACPFLTTFGASASETRAGAVTVVLTGQDEAKRRMVQLPTPRPFIRDSNAYSPDDPPVDGRWQYYALRWGSWLSWNGAGELSADERLRLEELVRSVHGKGRRLRLYGTPDTPAVWAASRRAGVDFINTDKLAELAARRHDP